MPVSRAKARSRRHSAGADAFDGQFFVVADGSEVVVQILEEAEEGFGILACKDEVFVAGESGVRPLRLEAALPSGVYGGLNEVRRSSSVTPLPLNKLAVVFRSRNDDENQKVVGRPILARGPLGGGFPAGLAA